jgi:hypothetical protein
MSNAAAYRTELSVASADYDRILADIKTDAIHAIVGVVMSLNKQGHRINISFEPGSLTISLQDANGCVAFIESHNSIALTTAAQMIDALEQLESIDSPMKAEYSDTDPISIIFTKEGEGNA